MTEKDMMNENVEENRLILLDDDNVEHEFEIIDIIEVLEKQYAVLLPIETDIEEDEEVEAVIMRVDMDGEEEVFSSIESDEEWDAVVNAYNDTLWEDE